jgi:hypothetical protein
MEIERMNIANEYAATEGAIAIVEKVVNGWIATGYPLEILSDCFITAYIDLSTDENGPEATATYLRRMADAVERGETGDVLSVKKSN